MTWIASLRLPGLPETQGCCNHNEFLDSTLSFEAEDVGYMPLWSYLANVQPQSIF